MCQSQVPFYNKGRFRYFFTQRNSCLRFSAADCTVTHCFITQVMSERTQSDTTIERTQTLVEGALRSGAWKSGYTAKLFRFDFITLPCIQPKDVNSEMNIHGRLLTTSSNNSISHTIVNAIQGGIALNVGCISQLDIYQHSTCNVQPLITVSSTSTRTLKFACFVMCGALLLSLMLRCLVKYTKGL